MQSFGCVPPSTTLSSQQAPERINMLVVELHDFNACL